MADRCGNLGHQRTMTGGLRQFRWIGGIHGNRSEFSFKRRWQRVITTIPKKLAV